MPETRVVEPEERFRAGSLVRYFDPVVSVQQRDVPPDCGAEFRIECCLCTAQGTVGDLQLKPRVVGQTPKDRRHILDGMRGDNQDAEALLSHRKPLRWSEFEGEIAEV